jgi:LacI family transcriptional regulator
MAKKLTLEEIGKLAGVSRSHVSRVINNQPDVSDDVRRRVQEIIQQTGYIPNPAARSLAAQHSGIVGLIIPRSVARVFGDPYFSRLTQGITQACYTNHYMLSLFLFNTKEDEQLILPHITQHTFLDGVIVQATTDADPVIPHLHKSSMPFLVIGRSSQMDPGINYIDIDNVSGAYKAVSHLINLGYRRIAHVAGRLDNRPAMDRKAGYEQALREHKIPIEKDLIVEGHFTEEGGYSCGKRLLKHKPDAIFVASDMMAFGVVRAIKEAGLVVPKDIAVVGFDDLPPSRRSNPMLTTVRQPILRFGASAVEVLIDIILNGSEPPRQTLYETELIIRDSCGANLQ